MLLALIAFAGNLVITKEFDIGAVVIFCFVGIPSLIALGLLINQYNVQLEQDEYWRRVRARGASKSAEGSSSLVRDASR